MKTRLGFLLPLLTVFTLSAQVEWRGGFPGRETDWQCDRNWSDNRVPDEMDHVVIPDCSTRGNYYPVVRTKLAQAQALDLHSGARLTILTGAKLSVFGYGLPGNALLNLGTLENNGTLEVIEPAMHAIQYTGNGTLIHVQSNLTADICEVDCYK